MRFFQHFFLQDINNSIIFCFISFFFFLKVLKQEGNLNTTGHGANDMLELLRETFLKYYYTGLKCKQFYDHL